MEQNHRIEIWIDVSLFSKVLVQLLTLASFEVPFGDAVSVNSLNNNDGVVFGCCGVCDVTTTF